MNRVTNLSIFSQTRGRKTQNFVYRIGSGFHRVDRISLPKFCRSPYPGNQLLKHRRGLGRKKCSARLKGRYASLTTRLQTLSMKSNLLRGDCPCAKWVRVTWSIVLTNILPVLWNVKLCTNPHSIFPPSPSSRLPFPPLPNKYGLATPEDNDKDAQISKHATDDTHTSRRIRTAGQKYSDDLGHFMHRTLWSPDLPAFLRGWVGKFSIFTHTNCAQIRRHNHLQTSRMAALSIRNFKRVENERQSPGKYWIHSENRQSKHSIRPLLVQKCKCPCCRHRACSCNFNQSRAEALPVARSLAPGEGRDGALRSGVWNDSQHSAKSAIFKTMGYSPGFLLKIGRFWTLANSPQIFTNNPESSWNPFARTSEPFQGFWDDAQHLLKSAIFKTMGYSPGVLLKIGRFRPLGNSSEIFTKNPDFSWQSISKHVDDVIFREIWTIPGSPKLSMFKTMGFCSKWYHFSRGLEILPLHEQSPFWSSSLCICWRCLSWGCVPLLVECYAKYGFTAHVRSSKGRAQ